MLIFVKYFSPILAGKILAGKIEVEVCTAISKGKQRTNIAMVLLQDLQPKISNARIRFPDNARLFN